MANARHDAPQLVSGSSLAIAYAAFQDIDAVVDSRSTPLHPLPGESLRSAGSEGCYETANNLP